MKAVVINRYGGPDVLEIKDIDQPVPQDDEVLVKVHAASLNAADWHIMRGDPSFARISLGLFRPKIKVLGADISGTVVSVGKSVTEFKTGDSVFGDLSSGNRKIKKTFGAFAEYVSVPSRLISSKPLQLAFEEAAAIPLAAITALQGLEKAKLQKGDQVLINGASGGVGTFAVQIAKALGAHVTAVCSSAKVEIVRSLGADAVVDYTNENVTLANDRYDVILAANGYHPILSYKRILKPKGRYVMVGGSTKQMLEAALLGPLHSENGGKQLSFLLASSRLESLLTIKQLTEEKKIKPILEKVYNFNEIREAMRHLEEGHAIGKIVIKVGH